MSYLAIFLCTSFLVSVANCAIVGSPEVANNLTLKITGTLDKLKIHEKEFRNSVSSVQKRIDNIFHGVQTVVDRCEEEINGIINQFASANKSSGRAIRFCIPIIANASVRMFLRMSEERLVFSEKWSETVANFKNTSRTHDIIYNVFRTIGSNLLKGINLDIVLNVHQRAKVVNEMSKDIDELVWRIDGFVMAGNEQQNKMLEWVTSLESDADLVRDRLRVFGEKFVTSTRTHYSKCITSVVIED